MDFSFRRRPLGTLYLKYTLMFGLIALAMFGGYVVTGHTLIWNTDALNQHPQEGPGQGPSTPPL